MSIYSLVGALFVPTLLDGVNQIPTTDGTVYVAFQNNIPRITLKPVQSLDVHCGPEVWDHTLNLIISKFHTSFGLIY